MSTKRLQILCMYEKYIDYGQSLSSKSDVLSYSSTVNLKMEPETNVNKFTRQNCIKKNFIFTTQNPNRDKNVFK